MAIVWKYITTGGQVKHTFDSPESITPDCGLNIYWNIPSLWANDPKELAKKRPCVKCFDLLSK